jgi:CheY-like chemotaxis protein
MAGSKIFLWRAAAPPGQLSAAARAPAGRGAALLPRRLTPGGAGGPRRIVPVASTQTNDSAAAAGKPEGTTMTSQLAQAAPPPRPPGVLLAEDHGAVRRLLCAALSECGFRVWPAADGEEAVSLYRTYRGDIDVAVLDVGLPVKDGPAALLALQPALPCCLMSGLADDEAIEGLLARGAARVLVKPFDLPELLAVLRRLAAGQGGGTPRPRAG